MDRYINKVIDNRYKIIEVIGSGGMAVVYKALALETNAMVAIKMLKDDYLRDADLVRRFHNESTAMLRLSHKNIVSVLDVSSDRSLEYFVMELIDGITLKQYILQRGVLSVKESLHFAIQILSALNHAHSCNIVHRDIKPQNIMILRDGSVKVTDFGIARLDAKQNTLPENAFGSVHYFSPEQARGEQTDGRSDIYSVGVILYEMLTGQLPYTGDTAVSVAIQHLNSSPQPLRERNENVPKAMETITLKAMCSDKDYRYKSALEMISDIEKFANNPAADIPFAQPPKREIQNDGGETRPVGGLRREQSEQVHARELQKSNKQQMKWLFIAIGIFVAGLVIAAIVLLSSAGGGKAEDIPVPDLVGKQIVEMQSDEQIKAQGIKIEIDGVKVDDPAPDGTILEQRPQAGAGMMMKPGGTIRVKVSRGPKELYMPDLVGKKENQIQSILRDADIMLEPKIEKIADDEVPAGEVIRTEPAEGTLLGDETEIIVYISKEKKPDPEPEITEGTMPKLVGLTLVQAEREIRDSNLDLKIGKVTPKDSDAKKDDVLEQSVDPGDRVKVGATIDLVVSSGKPVTPVPEVPTMQTQTVSITLPTTPERVQVKAEFEGAVVYEGSVETAKQTLDVNVTSAKSGTLKVYFDGTLGQEIPVNFNDV